MARVEIPDEVESPAVLSIADMMEEWGDEKTEMDKVFEHLLNPDNISQLTELTPKAIAAFCVAATVLERHKLPAYRAFIMANLVYRVSKSRQGRKELTKIVSRQMEKDDIKDVKSYGVFGRRRGGQ